MAFVFLLLLTAVNGLDLPAVQGTAQEFLKGHQAVVTVQQPDVLLPTVAQINQMTGNEQQERRDWFIFVFFSVFVCVVFSGTVILVVGAKIKACFVTSQEAKAPEQSEQAALNPPDVADVAPVQTALSPGGQKIWVAFSFGLNFISSSAAAMWSLRTGRLSPDTGLDWEVYFVLFCGQGVWLLLQACIALAWLRPGQKFPMSAFAVAAFSSMVPFIADTFDTLKDVIFGAFCLEGKHNFLPVLGICSWLWLLGFHAYFIWTGTCLSELASSYIPLLVISPEATSQKAQPGCCEWICDQILTMLDACKEMFLSILFKQVTPLKRWYLLWENTPQAGFSGLYVYFHGGSSFVLVVNLAVPLTQILLGWALYRPVLACVVPPLARKLNDAMAAGNFVAAQAVWEEAGLGDDEQLFGLFVPHLMFLAVQADKMNRAEADKQLYRGCKARLRLGTKGEAKVDLDFWQLGALGTKVLAKGLETNASVKELELGDNAIGDPGAKALGVALKVNSTLKILNLWHNQIGPDGAEALASGLRENRGLEELIVSREDVGEAGWEALDAAVKTKLDRGEKFQIWG